MGEKRKYCIKEKLNVRRKNGRKRSKEVIFLKNMILWWRNQKAEWKKQESVVQKEKKLYEENKKWNLRK